MDIHDLFIEQHSSGPDHRPLTHGPLTITRSSQQAVLHRTSGVCFTPDGYGFTCRTRGARRVRAAHLALNWRSQATQKLSRCLHDILLAIVVRFVRTSGAPRHSLAGYDLFEDCRPRVPLNKVGPEYATRKHSVAQTCQERSRGKA